MEKQLNELIIYRSLLKDPVIKKVRKLVKNISRPNKINRYKIRKEYYEICSDLIDRAEKKQIKGNVWRNYLLELIIMDENPFSLICEKAGRDIGKSIYDAAQHDLLLLRDLYILDWEKTAEELEVKYFELIEDFQPTFYKNMNEQNNEKLMDEIKQAFLQNQSLEKLIDYYHTFGCGDMGKYKSFRWDKRLIPVKNPDPVRLKDLIGYEYQKEILTKNTEAFVMGKKANNILLFGDRGTGKSSSVKAMVNEYAPRGLRMLELTKHQLVDFYNIIEAIKDRGQRFIIFMDDLSFEDFEIEYKYIKAVIEGGIEIKPDNLLIYATSNRRHLIKENWSDREDPSGEVHVTDSFQEKLSLVDRFGITITYSAPNQNQYLEIVRELAKRHSIDMPWEELKRKALQWEMLYNGRSGRTAEQFINQMRGQGLIL